MKTTTAVGRRPQLKLPGQAAAPDGPCDMSMMFLMHHAFRRDLTAFAAAVPRTPLDDRVAWKALAARWELFSSTLHSHHEGEDEHVWPALMDRAAADERAILEAMEAEHAVIDPTLTACRDGLSQMSDQPTEEGRSTLSVQLAAASEHLALHLEHEETDAIAFMQRVLTAEEWDAIEDTLRATLSVATIVRMVPWVLHGLPLAARRQLFAEMPGGRAYQAVWLFTRRRFERAERVAFAHLP